MLLGVLQSGCVRYSRIRRSCSSRVSSFQAAMSASLGVAEGITLFGRVKVSLMCLDYQAQPENASVRWRREGGYVDHSP